MWICAEEGTGLFVFEKKTEKEAEGRWKLRVSGDCRYKLFADGAPVCEGPCLGREGIRYYETAEVSLGRGAVLTAEVLMPEDGIFTTASRGKRAGLWIDGESEDGRRMATDGSWSCRRALHRVFVRGLMSFESMPPFEELLADERYEQCTVTELYEPHPERESAGPYGVLEPYDLRERPIPAMKTGARERPMEIERRPGARRYDAGRYVCADTHITVKAERGTRIRITYAECMQKDNDGILLKDMRDDGEGEILGSYDIIHGSGEEQTLDSFFIRAFRYIELRSEAEFEIMNLEFEERLPGMELRGRFGCSDGELSLMWQISERTLLCCTREIFVDCPYYEQAQYCMDSMLEAQFLYRLTADTSMQRKSIDDLAGSQLGSGLLMANYPSQATQIIPAFSLYWIMMLGEYLRYTGDSEFTARYIPCMDGIISCFSRLRGEDGLVGVTPYWQFIDWVKEWRDGVPPDADKPLTVQSLMLAAALGCAERICRAAGRDGLASEYAALACNVRESVIRSCYDRERGFFTDAPGSARVSEHTAVWAVLSGTVEGREAAELLRRTKEASAVAARCSHSMNYFMFRALEAAGLYGEYAPERLDGWRQMIAQHCTTWCESPDNPRSECHGWSSAPIYELSAVTLGVTPLADGYAELLIMPHPGSLSFACGTVSTPRGDVRVEWELREGRLRLCGSVPPGIKTTVVMNGETFCTEKSEFEF